MAPLTYTAIMSLDGYVADEGGSFDWAFPDEEVHAFANDLSRPVGLHLLGRRMYEVMAAWETEPSLAQSSPIAADFAAIWQAADKIVYSTTLSEPITRRTRIETAFDADEVRRLKASADREVAIAGPTLAAHALRAGLVDEVRVLVAPVAVGGGLAAFPRGLRLDLDIVERRTFESRQMSYLRALVRT